MNYKNLIGKVELGEYLGCSIGTIDNLMKKGVIEYIKIGSLVRFDMSVIEENIKVKSLMKNIYKKL
jgi:excisionase family DNA binding protein